MLDPLSTNKHIFSLLCQLLQVNRTTVNLPVTPARGVSVFKSGRHYTVAADFGVTVRYDGNHFMDIKVISEWVFNSGVGEMWLTQNTWNRQPECKPWRFWAALHNLNLACVHLTFFSKNSIFEYTFLWIYFISVTRTACVGSVETTMETREMISAHPLVS